MINSSKAYNIMCSNYFIVLIYSYVIQQCCSECRSYMIVNEMGGYDLEW